uniref:HTH_48 domain-containing protein n=1 Tax=Steinernema glaseri TaxID=37863 RepID=A0A1I8AC70_9BILA
MRLKNACSGRPTTTEVHKALLMGICIKTEYKRRNASKYIENEFEMESTPTAPRRRETGPGHFHQRRGEFAESGNRTHE